MIYKRFGFHEEVFGKVKTACVKKDIQDIIKNVSTQYITISF